MDSFLGFLIETTLPIPLGQMILFMAAITACFLYNRTKLGLIVCYCLVFYWGFVYNLSYFVTLLGEETTGFLVYIACGSVVALGALISFLRSHD